MGVVRVVFGDWRMKAVAAGAGFLALGLWFFGIIDDKTLQTVEVAILNYIVANLAHQERVTAKVLKQGGFDV
ncbi:MAG: hypothetical protein J7L14_03780 [Candidatus Diapherotrites archaeon]|nr:hypothetical protein [Candidatus Diapherotrites archaeon]